CNLRSRAGRRGDRATRRRGDKETRRRRRYFLASSPRRPVAPSLRFPAAVRRMLRRLYNQRVRALMRKEFNQIRRDRRLAFSLILPPTLQLLLFGFALSAKVTNLRLGVVDDSKTPESRELIATMSESKSFRLAGYYLSTRDL